MSGCKCWTCPWWSFPCLACSLETVSVFPSRLWLLPSSLLDEYLCNYDAVDSLHLSGNISAHGLNFTSVQFTRSLRPPKHQFFCFFFFLNGILKLLSSGIEKGLFLCFSSLCYYYMQLLSPFLPFFLFEMSVTESTVNFLRLCLKCGSGHSLSLRRRSSPHCSNMSKTESVSSICYLCATDSPRKVTFEILTNTLMPITSPKKTQVHFWLCVPDTIFAQMVFGFLFEDSHCDDWKQYS